MNLKLVKIYGCLFLPLPHVLSQVEFHLQRKKRQVRNLFAIFLFQSQLCHYFQPLFFNLKNSLLISITKGAFRNSNLLILQFI